MQNYATIFIVVIVMNLNFIVNKYLLMWNLLYQASVSEDIHKIKQKLWRDNKKEYSLLHKEKDIILNELDDYIPDDDLIYNILESSNEYKKIKQETNRYRLNLLEIWDSSRKLYTKELSKLLKYDLEKKYNVCVLHPTLDVVETNFDLDLIIIGKKIDSRDKDSFLSYLIYKILKNEFTTIKTDERDIITVMLELISLNELYTKISKESKYNIGKKELRTIKEKIYPYWLMYLGVSEEEFEKYMVRDNIFFNKNDYKYEKKLCNIDIFTFITFIINNKRVILNKKSIGVEQIEIETL